VFRIFAVLTVTALAAKLGNALGAAIADAAAFVDSVDTAFAGARFPATTSLPGSGSALIRLMPRTRQTWTYTC